MQRLNADWWIRHRATSLFTWTKIPSTVSIKGPSHPNLRQWKWAEVKNELNEKATEAQTDELNRKPRPDNAKKKKTEDFYEQ